MLHGTSIALAWTVALLVLTMAVSARAEAKRWTASGSASLLSDYRFRGVSYTREKIAIQGNATLAHDSGFYVGTYLSNLADYGGSNVELDLYAGYATQVAGFGVDVAFYQYIYPGGHNVNYAEVTARLSRTVGPVNLWAEAWYTPDQKNVASDNIYLNTGFDLPIARTPLTVRLRGGYEDGFFTSKLDWETRLTATFGRLEIHGAVMGTRSRRAEVGDFGDTVFVGGITTRF